MAGIYRVSAIVTLIVCLVGGQWSGTLLANQPEPSTTPEFTPGDAIATAADVHEETAREPAATVAAVAPTLNLTRFLSDAGSVKTRSILPVEFAPADTTNYAQRFGRRGRGRGNGGAEAALIVGAAAAIAGAAVLVYANRPDCNTNSMAGGCGYGTKVIGGAVLSGGVISLLVGALTWR
jgi:hypothetical protein